MKVPFRDGEREVPDHLAQFMTQLETYTMTYDEALAKTNAKLLSDRLDKAQDELVRQHFSRFPK